jgi:hypothetical protein
MAIPTPSGKTFLDNFTIIPSAKKWVFHATYRIAFLGLYGEKTSSMNRLVLTDEEDAEYKSFESVIFTNKSLSMEGRFYLARIAVSLQNLIGPDTSSRNRKKDAEILTWLPLCKKGAKGHGPSTATMLQNHATAPCQV